MGKFWGGNKFEPSCRLRWPRQSVSSSRDQLGSSFALQQLCYVESGAGGKLINSRSRSRKGLEAVVLQLYREEANGRQ